MNCPIDKTALEVVPAIGFCSCPTCHGSLFTAEQFTAFLDQAKAPTHDQLKEELRDIITEKVAAAGYETPTGLTCPVCSHPYIKQNYDYDSNIFIQHCEACGSMWLGQTELNRIIAYLAAASKFDATGGDMSDEAAADLYTRSAAASGQATHVYPYNAGRYAAGGPIAASPQAEYREHKLLAMLIRWPALYWVARVLIFLIWLGLIFTHVIISPLVIGGIGVALLILIALYEWALKATIRAKQEERRPLEEVE